MTKKEFEAQKAQRRRQFVNWLFEKVENDLRIKPSMFARAICIDYKTLVNLKKGIADVRNRQLRMLSI